MRSMFICSRERVRTWEFVVDPRAVDIEIYRRLVERATDGITNMFVKDIAPLFKMQQPG
jgi:hypothetical protein